MIRKNSVNIRVDGNLADKLERLQNIRIKNNLATNKEMNMPEITNLLMKTKGFRLSIEELKTKPKKR